jgi:signal transduction histidine kinase
MQTSFSEVSALTIIITTCLILFFAVALIFFLFLDQRKRFRHQEEVSRMKEAFNQALWESKLEIQEQTLDHISKELHANVGHLVSLININLSTILPQSSSDMKESILETKSLAKQLLADLRALSASLNTDHIREIGFARALENEVGRLEKTKRYKVDFSVTGDPYRISPEHEIILFRLSQEVLNNIVKYAKAGSVTTKVEYFPEKMCLEISDNGIGFDVKEVEKQSAVKVSTGFLNMRKRARLINGAIDINSEPGKGTRVSITIPQ